MSDEQTTAGRALRPAPSRPADAWSLALGNDEGSPAQMTDAEKTPCPSCGAKIGHTHACLLSISRATDTTEDQRERWLTEATALVSGCVPGADPARVRIAVHKIVEQIAMVNRSGRSAANFAKWRGAFAPWPQGDSNVD